MRVDVSPDKLKATLAVDPGDEQLPWPDESDIRRMAAEAGVTFGFTPSPDHPSGSGIHPREPIVVARGIEPGPGAPGWIEYPFEQSPVQKDAEATAELLHIRNVRTGDVVARIHPPEPGTAGRGVDGSEIPGAAGRPARCIAGENTRCVPDRPETIVATADGHARIAPDGSVEVQTVFRVNGDAGVLTGNIDFVGAVIITGDIKSDYAVRAGTSIEVHGSVGDALLTAGGDVVIREGFVGTGKGIIRAGGNVTVQQVHYQTIEADRDVEIRREAIAATIRASGRIIAPRAVIVGGRLEAGEEIEVLNLGNGEETPVMAQVGVRQRLLDRVTQLEQERAVTEKQLQDVRAAVYKLVRRQLDAGSLPPDQLQVLERLKTLQDGIPAVIDRIDRQTAVIQEALKNTLACRIRAHGIVAANALLEINGVRKLVQAAVREVLFVEKSGRIEQLAA